jgi:hypothetical protein
MTDYVPDIGAIIRAGRKDAERPAAVPIPLPQIHAYYVADEDTMPAAVRQMRKRALDAGWPYAPVTFSRGPYLSSSGQNLGIASSLVLSVYKDHGLMRSGFARWVDRKGEGKYAFDTAWKPGVKMNSSEFIAFLNEGKDPTP